MVNYVQQKPVVKLNPKLKKKQPYDSVKVIKFIRDVSVVLASAHIVYYVWNLL